MKLIGDFLLEQLSRALPAHVPEGAATACVALVLRDAVPEEEARMLAEAMGRMVASPEFAASLNRAVPPPRPGESEDEFVERTKAALSRLLLARFGR